jgi:hypothetical protein
MHGIILIHKGMMKEEGTHEDFNNYGPLFPKLMENDGKRQCSTKFLRCEDVGTRKCIWGGLWKHPTNYRELIGDIGVV